MADAVSERRPHARFNAARKTAICYLAYYSMRFYGFRPSLEAIRNDTYSNEVHTDRNFDNAKDLDGLLTVAKDCLKGASDRRAAISDKCKTLLTLSSLLLGLVGALLPKQLAFDAIWMRALVFLSVLTLLNAVALLIVFFGVGRDVVITLDQADINLEKDDLKKSLINTYLYCQTNSDCRTNYLVDLYKTARFFFLTAFSALVLLFSVNFTLHSESDQAKTSITQLRSDPKLVELLRGPKGENGVAGPLSQIGPRGEKRIVDEDEIVNRLINDPRLKRLLETELLKPKEKRFEEKQAFRENGLFDNALYVASGLFPPRA